MNDHDEERIINALADGLIDGDDTYDGKLTPRTRAANILAAMPKDATPRPTAESPTTEAGRALSDMGPAFVGGMTFTQLDEHILAIEAEAAALSDSALRDAADEMYAHITTYEDAMGHGYCATQSGDIEDPCTCGYEEKRYRWQEALLARPTPDDKPSLDAPDFYEVVAPALDSEYVAKVTGGPWESGEVRLVARYIVAALTKP